MPKVSVIIPTYNCAKYLSQAVASVLNQTYSDFEIIVVDDGSEDNTQEIVEGYVAKYPDKVRYFLQNNAGVSAARNKGTEESKGEYIAFLDADDELVPEALENYITTVSNSNAEWCITDILRKANNNKEIRVSELPKNNYFLNILKQDFIKRAYFFNKKSLLDVGCYDKDLTIREDWDLSIRMFKSNKEFCYINKPLYIYKIREKSLMKNNAAKVLNFNLKLLQKHHKQLADSGSTEIAKIYSEHMWSLARRYFYELKDIKRTVYCFKESLKYDFNANRLIHPLLFNLNRFAKRIITRNKDYAHSH